MKISRTKNAITGSAWGIVYRLICIFLPFIIRTIIIKKLGSEYLGLNSLFTSILQVLNLSELGLSNAIVYSMYKPIAEDDYDLLGRLLKYFRKAYLIIGVVVLIAGLACLPFLPKLISGSYPHDINIYILYIIFLLNTCVSYFFFGYKESILSAYQKMDVINIVRCITFSLQFITQIIILALFKNYYFYAISMIVFTVLRGLLNSIIVKKRYPQIMPKGDLLPEYKNRIRKDMSGISLGKICTVSRGACDTIIISSFLGLTLLAIFDNYYYIISAIVAFLTVIENSLVAGVGNSIVLETNEKNYSDFEKINFAFMFISTICSCCLAALFQPFMRIWVGPENMFDDKIMLLFVAYFYVSTMSSIASVYATAKGLWWKMKLKSIMEVIFNLTLNILLISFLGISGILIATIISLFFISFVWCTKVLYKEYFISKNCLSFIFHQVCYFLFTAVTVFVVLFLCELIDIKNVYLQIPIRLCVAVVTSIIVYSLLNISNRNLKYMFSFSKKLFLRRSK